MIRLLACLVAALPFIAQASPVAAGDREVWYRVQFSGATVGLARDRWQHDEAGLFYESHMEVGMKRLGTPVTMVIHSEELDDTAGVVLSFRAETIMSGARVVVRGEREGDDLIVFEESGGYVQDRRVAWEAGAIGQAGLDRLIAERLRQGETSFTERVFDPSQVRFQSMRFEVTGGVQDGSSGYVMVDQYIDRGQTPSASFWLDPDSYETGRVEINQLGIQIVIERVDAAAIASLELDPNFDVIRSSMIPCAGYPAAPRDVDEVTFRLTFSGPRIEAEKLRGPNQRVVGVEGSSVDVLVSRQPQPFDTLADTTSFLQSDRYIQADHPRIRALADSIAAASGKQGVELARELRGFVGRFITDKNMESGFASALDVLATRQGDCSEHAVLLTALLRAAGIPARVAVGLAYSDGNLVGHMWSEAYLDGWRTLDALDLAGDPVRLRIAASTDSRAIDESLLLDAYSLLGGLHAEVIDYQLRR